LYFTVLSFQLHYIRFGDLLSILDLETCTQSFTGHGFSEKCFY